MPPSYSALGSSSNDMTDYSWVDLSPQPLTSTGKYCLVCDDTSSRDWLDGPAGPNTLCKPCGLTYIELGLDARRAVGLEAILQQLRDIGAYRYRQKHFVVSATSKAKVVDILARAASPKRSRSLHGVVSTARRKRGNSAAAQQPTHATHSDAFASPDAPGLGNEPALSAGSGSWFTLGSSQNLPPSRLPPSSRLGIVSATDTEPRRSLHLSMGGRSRRSPASRRGSAESAEGPAMISSLGNGSLTSPTFTSSFGSMQLSPLPTAEGPSTCASLNQRAASTSLNAPRLPAAALPHTLRRSKPTLTDLRLASQLDQPDWLSAETPSSHLHAGVQPLGRTRSHAGVSTTGGAIESLAPLQASRSSSASLASQSYASFSTYSSQPSSQSLSRGYAASIASSSSGGSSIATMSRSTSLANLFSSVGSSGQLSGSWTDLDSLSIRSGWSGSSNSNLGSVPPLQGRPQVSRSTRKGSMSFLSKHEEARR